MERATWIISPWTLIFLMTSRQRATQRMAVIHRVDPSNSPCQLSTSHNDVLTDSFIHSHAKTQIVNIIKPHWDQPSYWTCSLQRGNLGGSFIRSFTYLHAQCLGLKKFYCYMVEPLNKGYIGTTHFIVLEKLSSFRVLNCEHQSQFGVLKSPNCIILYPTISYIVAILGPNMSFDQGVVIAFFVVSVEQMLCEIYFQYCTQQFVYCGQNPKTHHYLRYVYYITSTTY